MVSAHHLPVSFFTFFLFIFALARAQPVSSNLVGELGCGACHGDLSEPGEMYLKAPSLSYAGIRYNPAYVFHYLADPQRIRLHIGSARMPDFFLDERERLAIALYLETQKATVKPLPQFPAGLFQKSQKPKAEAKKVITEELKCTTCHKLNGEGGTMAVDLAEVEIRLNDRWLKQYLALPQAFDQNSSMPAQAYTLSEDGRRLTEVVPNAAEKIQTIANYLMDVSQISRTSLDTQFRQAKSRHSDITPQTGERIVKALNCAGCHSIGNIKPHRNAPDVLSEMSRVRPDWLRAYLKKPEAVRPFGYPVGTAGRMPDFRLSVSEQDSILSFFSRQPRRQFEKFSATLLTTFSREKAKTILRDKLPCLGCHQLNGEGGKIGPDLSAVGGRLSPDYLSFVIRDPQHAATGTIMPRVPLQDETLQLVTSFLSAQESNKTSAEYLSPVRYLPIPLSDEVDSKKIYNQFCSPCHGVGGKGDGYNSSFLPVKPADHSSKSYMATRSDDTIFDGIYGGGAILNKSHRMPPFGWTLDRDQIWSLVRYIRTLCKCEAPLWSRPSGN